MTLMRIYLVVLAVGLSIIGLGYGVAPASVLPLALDIAVEGRDLTHIFRAVMCLYFGISLYWLLAAFRPDWVRPAVMSSVFFIGGLGVGRLLSLLVDGLPSLLLTIYLLLEIAVALVGILLLRHSSRG